MNNTNKQDEPNLANDFADAVKKKIGSGYFFFVVLSFIGLNWRDLLLIIKSKEKIEALIPNLFQSVYFLGVHIWPWVFHFLTPVIMGVILSIISSYLNLLVVRCTSSANEWASRMGDVVRINADLKVLSLEHKLDEKKESMDDIKKEKERLKRECDISRDIIGDASSKVDSLLITVQSIIDLCNNCGDINSIGDFEKLISAINDSKFEKDDSMISDLKKISNDLKRIQESY